MHILIAEDELQNQKLLQRIIKMMGLNSSVTDNGKSVLESKESYNLLILDLSLTDMDGLEVAKAIRAGKTAHSPELPIMFLSGKSKDVMQKYCDDYSVNGYIEKPFGLDEIKLKVSSLLGL